MNTVFWLFVYVIGCCRCLAGMGANGSTRYEEASQSGSILQGDDTDNSIQGASDDAVIIRLSCGLAPTTTA